MHYICADLSEKKLQTVQASFLCCKVDWSGTVLSPLVDRTIYEKA